MRPVTIVQNIFGRSMTHVTQDIKNMSHTNMIYYQGQEHVPHRYDI